MESRTFIDACPQSICSLYLYFCNLLDLCCSINVFTWNWKGFMICQRNSTSSSGCRIRPSRESRICGRGSERSRYRERNMFAEPTTPGTNIGISTRFAQLCRSYSSSTDNDCSSHVPTPLKKALKADPVNSSEIASFSCFNIPSHTLSEKRR